MALLFTGVAFLLFTVCECCFYCIHCFEWRLYCLLEWRFYCLLEWHLYCLLF